MTVNEWIEILKNTHPELAPVYRAVEGELRHSFFAGQLSACGLLEGVKTYQGYEVEVQKLKRKIKDKGTVKIALPETFIFGGLAT